MYNTSVHTRRIGLLLLFLFIIAVLLTHCFIIAKINHECIGYNCPICSLLRSAAAFLAQIRLIACIMVVAFVPVCWITRVRFSYGFQVSSVSTPIGTKVRLNN